MPDTYLLRVTPSLPAGRWQTAAAARAASPEAAVRCHAPSLQTPEDDVRRGYTVVVTRLGLPPGGLGPLLETDCGSFRVVVVGRAVEVRPLRPPPTPPEEPP